NLVGFLLRPGVGEARDAWRVEQVWRLFDRGLQSPGATQARAEWWTLWKRVASGLTRQQQQALHQEIRPVLLPDARKKGKPSRWKGGPQEVREMWQVAGALERLPAGTKLEMLRALAPRVVADRASDAELWAFGRLAARAPLYGPANAPLEPSAVEPWLADLAARPRPRARARGRAGRALDGRSGARRRPRAAREARVAARVGARGPAPRALAARARRDGRARPGPRAGRVASDRAPGRGCRRGQCAGGLRVFAPAGSGRPCRARDARRPDHPRRPHLGDRRIRASRSDAAPRTRPPLTWQGSATRSSRATSGSRAPRSTSSRATATRSCSSRCGRARIAATAGRSRRSEP